jgi:hypothetical protein
VKFDDEVAKQLDAVVGDSYDPPRRWGVTLAKWAIAALLAVGMAAAIIAILHIHLVQAEKAPPPPRPVPIQIIPAK